MCRKACGFESRRPHQNAVGNRQVHRCCHRAAELVHCPCNLATLQDSVGDQCASLAKAPRCTGPKFGRISFLPLLAVLPASPTWICTTWGSNLCLPVSRVPRSCSPPGLTDACSSIQVQARSSWSLAPTRSSAGTGGALSRCLPNPMLPPSFLNIAILPRSARYPPRLRMD